MPKTRQIIRPHIRLQKLQRDVRKQFGTYKTTYLARVNGSVRLPGGLFWTHDANGVDANGNTTYGAPRKMPMLPGAAILPRPNTRVDVVTVQGTDYIARTNAAELERMGVDAHQSNTLDPAAQFTVLEWISNLQAFKTPGASSTHIVGSIYKKPDGTYDVFRTEGAFDFVTANIPSTDTQVVVCQWLNTDTNAITATVSSEISRDIDLKHGGNIADTMTLINECAASAPTNHIGVNAWRIYDDTTIATLNDNNKLADLRGIVGTQGSSAGGTITGDVLPSTCEGRLTLESGVAVSITDQTAKTTVYFTPYKGAVVALYDGSSTWTGHLFTERSLSLSGLTANTNYDIFLYDAAGTLTLEAVAWTNDTTRATALAVQNGVYVKTGATERRWLGTIRITGTTGQCEDSQQYRYVYNWMQQVRRTLRRYESTASWTHNGAWRQWNNSATNRVAFVLGQPAATHLAFSGEFGGANSYAALGILLDGTSGTPSVYARGYPATSTNEQATAIYDAMINVGYHYLQAMEYTTSAVNMTYYGYTAGAHQYGLSGFVDC